MTKLSTLAITALFATACQSHSNSHDIQSKGFDPSQWQGQYYFNSYETEQANEERGIGYGVEFTVSYDENYSNNACRIWASGYQVYWNDPCELRATSDNNIISIYNPKMADEFAQVKQKDGSYFIDMIHYSEETDGFEPVQKMTKKEWMYDDYRVQTFVDTDTLTCSSDLSYEQAFDFWSVADELSLDNFDKKNKLLVLSPNQRITGVNQFSKSQSKDESVIVDKAHIDVDFSAFGVQVMRISQFNTKGIKYSEYDASGYYFVLKGLPNDNAEQLLKHGIDIENSSMTIEETKGGNTGLSCVIAG